MFDFLKKGIPTPIAIGIILVLAVLVGGFTIWQLQKKELGGEINLQDTIKEEGLGWRTLESKDFSFRFSEDIWEFTKENRGFIVDGRLLHNILDQCEIWIGAPAHSVCPVGEEPGEETDCEVTKEERTKVELNERDFIEKISLTVRVEQDNHVLVIYKIFQGDSWEYTIELITVPDYREDCIDDFEKTIKTFKFAD